MAARTALLRFSVEADHSTPRLAAAVRALLRRASVTLLHPYRPERHYMRGPGPRWHAKHDLAGVRREPPAV
ncbi:MAG: hypothetical protein GEU91_01305 [Rhizobiales bacterium]|nr:hypothetical protein [Hyphomicrobiales bacterium]